jgi:hypothetical protein
MGKTVTIKISKKKILFLFSGASLFLAIGFWMFFRDDAVIRASTRFNNPIFVHAAGLANIVTSAFILIGIMLKLFRNIPGLLLDEKGLTDNSSFFSAGFVAWSDISGVQAHTVSRYSRGQILYVILKEPEKYIDSCGLLKRTAVNILKPVSPVGITSSTLVIGFDEMVLLIEEYLSLAKSDG